MWALKVIFVEAKTKLLQVHQSCWIKQFECNIALKSSEARENITQNRNFKNYFPWNLLLTHLEIAEICDDIWDKIDAFVLSILRNKKEEAHSFFF